MVQTKDNLIDMIINSPEEFSSIKKELKNIDLSEADFSALVFKNLNLSDIDLSNATFSDATLQNINFSGADLTSTDLTSTNIVECDFSDAILNGTDFSYANIKYSNFSDADLSGAIFQQTDLSGADLSASLNLTACRFDEETIWPDSDMLPDDFDTSYVKDLSHLHDDDDDFSNSEIY